MKVIQFSETGKYVNLKLIFCCELPTKFVLAIQMWSEPGCLHGRKGLSLI